MKVLADDVHGFQAKYLYHIQGNYGEGSSDLSDPVIMSFFLALPVASMMWALLCFFVALAALSIHVNESTRTSTALWVLSAMLCTGILVGVATVVHFERIHRRPVTWEQSSIGVGEHLD